MSKAMTRRSAMKATTGIALASQMKGEASNTDIAKGRLKQSASLWCYESKGVTLDQLCRASADMGLKGIDLVDYTQWPTVQKYGLVPSMTPGAGTISDCWNRVENHDRLEKEMQENITRAAKAKVPNVITFSGNRKGLPDDQGLENCAKGLKRVKKMAEDSGIMVCVELLNSKIDHHDYQLDHTAWGVQLMKRVDSTHVKLLYDIYHMQIMEGDVIRTIRDNFQYLAHFHTGGVPGRHELDETQELQWRSVAKAIADLNYQGFFAHEFVPTRDPLASLKEAAVLCTV